MGVWTDKKIEKLKELWKEGIPTAEIGKRLDFSKNAIVGKVNRLGLEHRTSPIKTASKSKKEQEVKEAPVHGGVSKTALTSKRHLTAKNEAKVERKGVEISQLKSVAKQNSSEGVHLIDLTSDRCCWPVDDGNSGDFCFCGKKVFKGKPYCLEHCVMAYTNSSVLKEKDKTEG